MYEVSDEFIKAMRKPVQRSELKGTIGKVSFTDKNILTGSFSITNQCSGSTNVEIGQVYIGELDVTLMNLNLKRYSLQGLEITPSYGLRLEDGSYEHVPLGVYIVNEANWTASGVEIKAYDKMSLLDKSCSATAGSGYPYDLAIMACNECKVKLAHTRQEFEEFPNGKEEIALFGDNDVDTWRDYLSWLSQTLGCFVTANREGEIEFRKYGSQIVDTIDTKRRFTGASFSDFETRYTGVSCVNIADKTTSYYGLETDDALTYNLGSNPFMQYGVDKTEEDMRRAVLDAISVISYVPFKVKMLGSPAYDLGDVFSFSDGIADEDKLFCMTKFVYTYNAAYEMQGVGQNPALANAKSKVDKDISGLISNMTESGVKYITYLNPNDIDIADGDWVSTMNIRFASAATTHVEAEMQFLLSVDSKEEIVDGYYTEKDVEVTAKYYLDGIEIVDVDPVETYQDGKHVLRLRYDFGISDSTIHHWNCWLNAKGGNVHIDAYDVLGIISGNNLAGDGDWDGTINAEDNIERVSINIIKDVEDKADIRFVEVTRMAFGESISPYNFASIIGNVTESVGVDNNIMTFNTVVNLNLLNSTATISGSAFSNGEIITPTIKNVRKIAVIENNCEFYISVDDGVTWCGYAGGNWVADMPMTGTMLSNVPASAYENEIKLKVILKDQARLTNIDIYGGHL